MMIMSMGFNPKGPGTPRLSFSSTFPGKWKGPATSRIENGRIEPREGRPEKPDLIIETPFDVWMDIMTGKADGQQMFMEQKYRVNGDLSLLMRMNQIFGKSSR